MKYWKAEKLIDEIKDIELISLYKGALYSIGKWHTSRLDKNGKYHPTHLTFPQLRAMNWELPPDYTIKKGKRPKNEI